MYLVLSVQNIALPLVVIGLNLYKTDGFHMSLVYSLMVGSGTFRFGKWVVKILQ